MNKCRWCGSGIHPKMEGECVSCWALRCRVEAHPDIAKKMLIEIMAIADRFKA